MPLRYRNYKWLQFIKKQVFGWMAITVIIDDSISRCLQFVIIQSGIFIYLFWTRENKLSQSQCKKQRIQSRWPTTPRPLSDRKYTLKMWRNLGQELSQNYVLDQEQLTESESGEMGEQGNESPTIIGSWFT